MIMKKFASLLLLFITVACGTSGSGHPVSTGIASETSASVSSDDSVGTSVSETLSQSEEERKMQELIKELETIFSLLDLSEYGYRGRCALEALYDRFRGEVENLSSLEEMNAYSFDRLREEISAIRTIEESYSEDLMISEFWNIGYDKDIHPEGNNNNKAIELYNPLTEAIDLSSYVLEFYSNGSDVIKNESYRLALTGSLEGQSTLLIVNQYAEEALRQKADVVSTVYIGAKSAVGLYRDGALIDVFGYIGRDYGTNDDYVINGVPSACDNHNVKRKSACERACAEFVEREWDVAFDTDFSTLGSFKEGDEASRAQAALRHLVDYWTAREVHGDIALISEYEGFTFTYDFYNYYYDAQGHMLIEPEDDFPIYFALSVLSEDGERVLFTSYDPYVVYVR